MHSQWCMVHNMRDRILIVILIVLHRTSTCMALVYGTVLVCLECTLVRTFGFDILQCVKQELYIVLTLGRFLLLVWEKLCYGPWGGSASVALLGSSDGHRRVDGFIHAAFGDRAARDQGGPYTTRFSAERTLLSPNRNPHGVAPSCNCNSHGRSASGGWS